MDLNKHVISNNASRTLHSNSFAVAVNGNRIGATGNISFNRRQHIEQNRQNIDSYHQSNIGMERGIPRAISVDADKIEYKNVTKRSSLQQNNSLNIPPPRFREPSSRGYNPFS